ncbi:MAG: OST-HTH/LOTUS domain-containing protein, partial [Ruthenibacterium sp.]
QPAAAKMPAKAPAAAKMSAAKQKAAKAKAALAPAELPPETPAEPTAHSEEELVHAFVPLGEIVEKIREIIDYDSDEDGYMPLSQVGVTLSRMYADFDSRNYGFNKLHKLIDYTGAFETKYEQFENGGRNLMVRNKA